MLTKVLASAVFVAADIHKGSFCKKCYVKAVKEGEAKAKADPANAESYKPNPENFYHVTIPAASYIATHLVGIPGSQKAVELMLTNSWEESTAWAKEIVNPEPEVPELPPELKEMFESLIKNIFGR